MDDEKNNQTILATHNTGPYGGKRKKNNQGKRITLDRKEVRAKKNNQGKLTIDT